MRLIVGLGNPGKEYRETRHNVGFMVVDEIARRHSLTWAMAPGQVPETFVAKRFGEVPMLLAKLPFTRLRARAHGSAGGHNALKTVIERLGSTEFPRLRLGVGRGDGRRDLADHVLAKFESGERADLETFITRAADAAEMFAVDGIGKVMNTYNPDATAPDND